jgi:hypothetical protein
MWIALFAVINTCAIALEDKKMSMSVKKVLLTAIAGIGFTAAVNAAPITTTLNGSINVLGTDYLVSLLYDDANNSVNQSFNALMPSITFTTEIAAKAAATALRDTYGVNFNWHPLESVFDGVRIAFGVNATNYQYVTVVDCCGGTIHGAFDFSRDSANIFSFAQFKVKPTSEVPEPQTYLLMALGLAGIAAARRRQA